MSKITSLLAPQNKREYRPDIIFGANAVAQDAVAKFGKENVTVATIGAILDENEEHVFLKAVEQEYRNMPSIQLSQYAPIAGLPKYLDEVQKQCFGEYAPEGDIRTVAMAGGTGGIHHLIHMYTEIGDEILTADWHWGAYGSLCADQNRKLATYRMLTKNQKLNLSELEIEMERLAEKQKNILLIVNTPAHNPTGYSVSDDEWDQLIIYLKSLVARGKNRVILGVDVAYLDFAGEKNEVRRMFKKLGNLPAEILPVVIYSLSKGYTLYGQRTGALIAVSSEKQIADEFYNAAAYSSRATWSNINRSAMSALVEISKDKEKQRAYEEERDNYYQLIKERAQIFMQEAMECDLKMVPYHGGFFLSIPTDKSIEVCKELYKENIFLVPLLRGMRIAVCAVPKRKIYGLAKKIKQAMEVVGE